MQALLHGEEKAVFGDKGYFSDPDKRAARKTGLFWGVLDKAKSKKRLSNEQKRRNRKLSSIRAKVEHPFRVVKRQFGYMKVRYRGLTKIRARVLTWLPLPNLIELRVVWLGNRARMPSVPPMLHGGRNEAKAMSEIY